MLWVMRAFWKADSRAIMFSMKNNHAWIAHSTVFYTCHAKKSLFRTISLRQLPRSPASLVKTPAYYRDVLANLMCNWVCTWFWIWVEYWNTLRLWVGYGVNEKYLKWMDQVCKISICIAYHRSHWMIDCFIWVCSCLITACFFSKFH